MSQRPSILPNVLTITRLIAAPVVAGLVLWADALFFSEARVTGAYVQLAATAVFLLAALTDALDGPLARRLGAVSPVGAALDHAADKALTTATLAALIYVALPLHLVIAALIIVVRDVTVAGLREGLSLSGRALPVSLFGKLKTVTEMIGIAAFLLLMTAIAMNGPPDLAALLSTAAGITLWIAAAAAVLSGLQYAWALRGTKPPGATG